MPCVFACTQRVGVNILADCAVMIPFTSIYRTRLCRISLCLCIVIISLRLDQCFNYNSSSVSCCKLSSLASPLVCRSHFPAGSVTCVRLAMSCESRHISDYTRRSQAPSAQKFKYVQNFIFTHQSATFKPTDAQSVPRQGFKLRPSHDEGKVVWVKPCKYCKAMQHCKKC